MVDVTIRQMCVEDINTDYISWLNDSVVNKYLETKHSSFSSCLRYVKNKTLDPKSMMFVILADGVMVGTCTLSSIDFVDGSACLGMMIGKKEV